MNYKDHEVTVEQKGFRRYLLIDGQRYSLSSMDVPELAARKLIDGDLLDKSNSLVRKSEDGQ